MKTYREVRSILRQCRENPCKVAKIHAEPPLCFSVLGKVDVDGEAVAYLWSLWQLIANPRGNNELSWVWWCI